MSRPQQLSSGLWATVVLAVLLCQLRLAVLAADDPGPEIIAKDDTVTIITPEASGDVRFQINGEGSTPISVRNLADQVTALDAAKRMLMANVTTLAAASAKAEDKSAATQGQLAAARARLDRLNGSLATLDSRTAQAEQNISSLASSAASRQSQTAAQIVDTRERVATLNTTLGSLGAALQDELAELSANQSRLRRSIEDIDCVSEATLRSVLSEIIAAQVTARLQAMEARLNASINAISCSGGASQTPPGDCGSALARAGASEGEFVLLYPDGTQAATQCRLFDGRAWALAARVTGDGDKWRVTDGSESGSGNPWETSTTFGSTAAGTSDFKGPAYSKLTASAVLIEYNSSPILETMNCFDDSLAGVLASLSWSCNDGTISNTQPPACLNPCPIIRKTYPASDPLLMAAFSNFLLVHAGESPTYNPTNNDRSYISGSCGAACRASTHEPSGLGSYCAGGGCTGGDGTQNIGIAGQDGVVSPSGNPRYNIWVASELRSQSPLPTTCAAALNAAKVKRGLFNILLPGTSTPALTSCLQEESTNEVWTLAGRITGRGTAWRYTDASNEGSGSPFETTTIFGAVDGGLEDYKGFAWTQMPSTRVLVRYNGQTLLETEACWASSLRAYFNTLSWECTDGTVSNTSPQACLHACRIVSRTYPVADNLLMGSGNPSAFLYFQAGERSDYDPTNNDRAYISGSCGDTCRGSTHVPSGLGSYCAGGCSGASGSQNVGIAGQDGAVMPGDNVVYEIFVQ